MILIEIMITATKRVIFIWKDFIFQDIQNISFSLLILFPSSADGPSFSELKRLSSLKNILELLSVYTPHNVSSSSLQCQWPKNVHVQWVTFLLNPNLLFPTLCLTFPHEYFKETSMLTQPKNNSQSFELSLTHNLLLILISGNVIYLIVQNKSL